MKIFTLMTAVALTAVPTLARDMQIENNGLALPMAGIHTKARTADMTRHGQPASTKGRQLKKVTKKTARILGTEADELITQAPAGELHSSQLRSSTSFYVEWGWAYQEEVEAMAGEFVVGDDGYIYVKNPFAFDQTDTYMKLHLEGNEAVMEGPQLIDSDDVYGTGEEEDLYVARLKYDADEDWYYIDEETSQIVFNYTDGKLSQRQEEDIMYGLVTADGDWLGFGDWNLVMQPMDDEILSISDTNAEAKEYTMSHLYGANLVKVTIDGDNVYLAGLNTDMPEACIKGTISGSEVTFSAAQYIGVVHHVGTDYHAWFMPAVIEQQWIEDWEMYMEVYEATDAIVFTLDQATGVMKSDDVILTNASKTQTYYLDAYEEPTLKPYPGKKPAVPATPVVTEYLPIDDHFGDGDIYGGISFILYSTDVDGNYINVHDLCYNIIINDEVFTFTPDEFVNLTESMTDIPYDFTDEYDIQINDIYHNIYFHNPEYTKIGVQAKYEVDGVTNVSEIAYYEDPSGIDKTSADAVEESVKYTDMLGNQVSRPASGIYIKTVTYSDGTVKNVKVLKK